MLKKYRVPIILMFVIWFGVVSIIQTQAASPDTAAQTDDLARLETLIKIIGGVITGLAALIGLPIVILNFQKTRAEIRKLELEAVELQNQVGASGEVSQHGNRIEINSSDHINIEILADPRFLGPLLILLDFILAWGVLTLAGYVINFFFFGFVRTIITVLLAVILLVPIIREAMRVRKNLRLSDNSANGKSGDTK